MCLTRGSMQRMDAETETLIPTRGGGFDVATFNDDGTARTLTHRYDSSPCVDRGPDVVAFSYKDSGNDAAQDLSPTLRSLGGYGANGGGQMAVAYGFKAGQGEKAHGIGWQEECAPTLSAGESGTQRSPGLLQGCAVRRLTPRECERLQGMADDVTNVPWRGKGTSPDGPRYKAIGNSWALNCIEWIGERMLIVDAWD